MRNRIQAFLEARDGAGLVRLADSCAAELEDPASAYRAVGRFVAALAAAADQADSREWSVLRRALSLHPLAGKLRRDPLVAQAWRAGSAAPETTLGDLMLRHPEAERLVRAADRVGRNIYAATSALPGPEAVRDRRRLIARVADSIAEQRPGAEILAIAPGHMREAEATLAGPSGGIRRWVGLVSEPEAATEIARSLPLPWVLPIRRSPLATLLRPDLLGQFDFAYCKSLEIMADAVAESLLVAAFARLRPGGRLLVACRSPGAPDAAFWALAGESVPYPRDEAMLARLSGALDPREIAARRAFGGINEAIAYLEVVKA
jgi:SAM-dependent methyltransferase